MIRLNRLMGLPVIYQGRMMGRVEAGHLTEGGDALLGLVIRSGLRGARWLPAAHIAQLGGVSVLISRPPLRLPPRLPALPGPVWDPSGLRLGSVTDVALRDLEVAGLIISLGPMDDWRFGRMLARRFTLIREPRCVRVLTPLDGLTPLGKEDTHEPW